jgi:lysozyme family protein
MARFEDAIPTIMAHEGGWASDGLDGGGTNYGITLDTFRKVRGPEATVGQLRSLSADEAEGIYRSCYWSPIYDLIDDQDVATKTLDLAVNSGPRRAHIILQRACTACGFRVVDDGALGPMTLAAVNSCHPADLLLAMCHEQIAFYRALVEQDPKYAPFLAGWLVRAAWVGPKETA